MPYYLYLFALSIAGMPAGLLLRRYNISLGALMAFLFLLIDLFIGLNTPNPEMVKVIAVTTP